MTTKATDLAASHQANLPDYVGQTTTYELASQTNDITSQRIGVTQSRADAKAARLTWQGYLILGGTVGLAGILGYAVYRNIK